MELVLAWYAPFNFFSEFYFLLHCFFKAPPINYYLFIYLFIYLALQCYLR